MFIISEISPQFSGKVEVAEQMILQSKLAGGDAIKVQLYDEVQFGKERAYLSMTFNDLKRLKQFSDNLNIPLFATPFNFERLDWCLKLDLPFLKVAARMHQEMPELVEAIMKQNKKTFVSIPSDSNPDDIEKRYSTRSSPERTFVSNIILKGKHITLLSGTRTDFPVFG